jgi:hypothetical protein
MPNQLAQSKKRMTVAEETAVLAALEVIAQADNLTVTDLLRQGVRNMIAERAANPDLKEAMRRVVEMHAPVMPEEFRSPAKVSKFKRSQREFDQLLKELNLFEAEELQRRNSLVETREYVRLTEFTG